MQSKNRKSQGSAPANPKKAPLFQQWWFWLTIVAVAGCLCIILLKYTSTKPDPTPATLDTSPVNTYTTCGVGETFDANGMHITYVGAETWLPAGETSHPKEGYTFLRIKISAENKAAENREIYSNEFTCIADGGRQTFEYFTDEALPTGIFAPGERTEGYLYYSIPSGAQDITLEYTSYLTWRNHIALLPVDLAE